MLVARIFCPSWPISHIRRLIARLWALNAVRLVRVGSESAVTGYLYNLLWQGKVYQFQNKKALVNGERKLYWTVAYRKTPYVRLLLGLRRLAGWSRKCAA